KYISILELHKIISDYYGYLVQEASEWEDVVHIAGSPDGKQVALICSSDDNKLYILNSVTAELIAQLVHSKPIVAAAYLKNNDQLVTTDENSGFIWDSKSFQFIKQLPFFG